jgi:hypothetical protein
MIETLTPRRSVTATQLQQLQDLGRDVAALESPMSERTATAVRAEIVRLTEALKLSPRQVGLPPDGAVGPEIHRIAARLADILRATPPQEHSALWASFGSSAREHLEMYRFAAEWAIAWWTS